LKEWGKNWCAPCAQEFRIVGDEVYIVNRVSHLDGERKKKLNKEDKMFNLENPKKLEFGKLWNQLNLVLLIPKTDSRGSDQDLTLGNMIRSRIDDQEIVNRMTEKFSGRNSENIRRVKIQCEIHDMDSNLIFVGLSEAIVDTNSKKHGVLDIHDASPLKSCEKGGRKIQIISEFGLSKEVKPKFLLFDEQDNQITKCEEHLLNQPKDKQIQRFKDSCISFIAPMQERQSMQTILANKWKIKIALQRDLDGVLTVSQNKPTFEYVPHDYFNFYFSTSATFCIFCDFSPDISANETPALAELRKRAAPNRKKRRMLDVESDSNNMRDSTETRASRSPTSEADVDSPQPVYENNSVDSGYFTDKSKYMAPENISYMNPTSSRIEYPTLSLHEMYPETDDEIPMVWNQSQTERSLETPPPTDLQSFQMQQSMVKKKPPTFTGYLPDIVKDGVKSKEILDGAVTEHSKNQSNISSKICKGLFGVETIETKDMNKSFILKQFGMLIPIIFIVVAYFNPPSDNLALFTLGILLCSLIWKVFENTVLPYVF
jgi:hypothetical protein